MKKYAVCLVGQLRTGTITMASIKRYIGKLWDECDFYVHMWSTNSPSPGIEEKNTMLADTLHHVVNTKEINAYINYFRPRSVLIEDYREFKAAHYKTERDNVTPLGMPFYHSVKMAVQTKSICETAYNFRYDRVILLRHDSVLSTNRTLSRDLALCKDENTFLSYDMHKTEEKVDSTLWLTTSSTMDRIAKFYDTKIENNDKSDDQLGLRKWVAEYCGKTLIFVHDGYWIYRKFHQEENISVFDFEKLIETELRRHVI